MFMKIFSRNLNLKSPWVYMVLLVVFCIGYLGGKEHIIGRTRSSLSKWLTQRPSSNIRRPWNGVIDIWYGSHQVFGLIGRPQRWVNILGNVSDPDAIASLTYSLNGEPELPLSRGPDSRRLLSLGDFNIEIAYTDLKQELNYVVITATDHLNNVASETVTVEYSGGNSWPETYSINWSSAKNIQDVAQIVDGLWALEADGIRPVVPGYDRVVAIGDVQWDNYEVTVPITIHKIDQGGFKWPSNHPGLGISLRWPGHTDWGGSQPTIGWKPSGAGAWYSFRKNGGSWLGLGGENGLRLRDTSRRLEVGVRYNWRVRVETVSPGQGGLYSLKVWKDDEPEPSEWDLSGQEGPRDLSIGSLILIAHHVDATFGDVTIIPLADSLSGPTDSRIIASDD